MATAQAQVAEMGNSLVGIRVLLMVEKATVGEMVAAETRK
jgi:hypothetical protein